MQPEVIEIEEALKFREAGALLVDVRTPAEFADATIPGAVNVPIFSNEERAEVGTLYKQQGKAVARSRGVEIVAPRIPALIAEVERLRGDRGMPVVVLCWRGGMRSRAMTAFLNLAGVPARQLVGGHKAFRTLVLDFLEGGQWGRMLVLRGLTGVGKTQLLGALATEGYPVIDLEGLASHRGSAFGAVGLAAQPSQKMFEALLWDALRKVPPGGYALTEGESRRIGRLVLPPRVYESLQVETSLWVQASLDYRVEVILRDYPAVEEWQAAFVGPIEALKGRLGAEAVGRLLGLLDAGRWRELVRELMVLYYDPLYDHTKPQRRIEIDIEPIDEGLGRLRRAIAELLGEEGGK